VQCTSYKTNVNVLQTLFRTQLQLFHEYKPALTRHAGVVDLHVDGVSAAAHQVRIADVDRAVIASITVDPGRQVRQLDTVPGRRPIPTRRVQRRNPVERLDHSDQLRAAVRPRRTPESERRHTRDAEALAGHVYDR